MFAEFSVLNLRSFRCSDNLCMEGQTIWRKFKKISGEGLLLPSLHNLNIPNDYLLAQIYSAYKENIIAKV